MKYLPLFFSIICTVSLQQSIFAANVCPDGIITFYNAMPNTVTAQIDGSKIILAKNQSQNIKYSDLSKSCGNTPTNCKANFYIDDAYAGYATFNTLTGKIVNLNLSLKIIIAKSSDNIVRSVSIEQ